MSEMNGVARGEWDATSVTLAEARRVKRQVAKARVDVPSRPVKARKARGKAMRGARKLALAVGAVGTGLLGLSVSHCTESIGLLTGSHWLLAGLLAVGIDAGMVACELAELAASGKRGGESVSRWSRGYIVAAILLSVVLNAYAFGLHAAPGMMWAAWALGAAIPGLVYCLGQVAGGLWAAE